MVNPLREREVKTSFFCCLTFGWPNARELLLLQLGLQVILQANFLDQPQLLF